MEDHYLMLCDNELLNLLTKEYGPVIYRGNSGFLMDVSVKFLAGQ